MSEPIKKPNQTNPESYSPKIPKLVNMMEKEKQNKLQNIPEQFSVTERGVRETNNGDPQCMVFPALMRALGTFLGLENHPINDYNYAFQMGITTEGFALYYDAPFRFGGTNKWGATHIKNALAVGGVKYRIAGADESIIHDMLVDFNTIKTDVCLHICHDKPILIKKEKTDTYLFVTGYKENGDVLIAFPFFGGGNENHALNLKANCQEYSDWMDNLEAIIYIDGFGEPKNEKRIEIIKETLKIAYEMLTDTQLTDTGNYDYGNQLYKTWIARLDNDANYENNENKMKYIWPETPDYDERRLYAAGFFEQCDKLIGKGTLIKAGEAFAAIHDKLQDIYKYISGENGGRLPERETRDKIIAILKKCHELDLVAAEYIKKTLEVDLIGTEAK
ncbi:MAG: transcriptional regulator [Clostridia bacterium]|nr:transcriptional regulator [Clostridia bacterium]